MREKRRERKLEREGGRGGRRGKRKGRERKKGMNGGKGGESRESEERRELGREIEEMICCYWISNGDWMSSASGLRKKRDKTDSAWRGC